MVSGTSLTVGIAFLAGLASFLSPCIVPLIPAYIGYLGGHFASPSSPAGADQDARQGQDRVRVLGHALAFIFGFSLIFILFNIVAAALGLWLGGVRDLVARLGGLLVIVFGLHTLGLFRIPWLEYDWRIHAMPAPTPDYLSSALMGIIFSAGWSPCIGPTLGMIMTLAMHDRSAPRAVLLGVAFSAGLAVPFLLAALGVDWVIRLLRQHRRLLRGVNIALGLLLILVGCLLVLGSFNWLTTLFPPISLFGL